MVDLSSSWGKRLPGRVFWILNCFPPDGRIDCQLARWYMTIHDSLRCAQREVSRVEQSRECCSPQPITGNRPDRNFATFPGAEWYIEVGIHGVSSFKIGPSGHPWPSLSIHFPYSRELDRATNWVSQRHDRFNVGFQLSRWDSSSDELRNHVSFYVLT